MLVHLTYTYLCMLKMCGFSWMGRTIIERPLRVIADFLEDPASAMIYDKHIMVC